MLDDIELMDAIEDFLTKPESEGGSGLSKNYVDSVYTYSPESDKKDPYIIVSILTSNEERREVDGGNEYEVQAQVSILTTNYSFGTPELKDSIQRLYVTTREVRKVLESSNYLEYVRRHIGATASTLRIGDITRVYGQMTAGDSQHLTSHIITPFIIFQDKPQLS